MLYDDSREAGQDASADDPVIICQALVRIERVVLAFPYQKSQIVKTKFGELAQDRIGECPAFVFQIRPVISRSHKNQRTADRILVVLRGIDMLADKNRRFFTCRIVYAVLQGHCRITGSGHIDRHTGILFQLCLGISGNLQIDHFLFIKDTVPGPVCSGFVSAMAGIQHHDDIAACAGTAGGSSCLNGGRCQCGSDLSGILCRTSLYGCFL